MELEFVKMQGIGNDFIVIDDRALAIDRRMSQAANRTRTYPDLARQLCSRHFGIGADGILLIQPSEDHDFKFRIYNSDGSSAQMCGNGLRCVARLAYETRIVAQTQMRVDTLAGTMKAEVITDDNGQVISVRVDMGEPELNCIKIPFDSPHETSGEKAIEVPLAAGGRSYTITAVSMGNPHAVIFVDDVDRVDLKAVGPAIENHDRFPEKTNVEFIEVVSPDELKMRVWERGAGITLACGTGACAALVAATLTGRADGRALIHLDGGDLEITWDKKSNHLFMQGPAVSVFSGRIRVE